MRDIASGDFLRVVLRRAVGEGLNGLLGVIVVVEEEGKTPSLRLLEFPVSLVNTSKRIPRFLPLEKKAWTFAKISTRELEGRSVAEAANKLGHCRKSAEAITFPMR